MFTYLTSGQYGNGSGFPGGYVIKDAFGTTRDANGRQVHRLW